MDAVQLSETVVGHSDGEDIWRKKYHNMKRKCEEYEELNSIVLTRTKKIREMISQAAAEKRLLMKRLEQYGMVALHLSPPSSPQDERLPPLKVEQHTPPPLVIEDTLQPHEFRAPPVLSPLPTPKCEPSPKPPNSKPKSSKGKGGGGGRKKRGDGNSNAPKKPSNAFFWFCQEHRGSLQDQFRGEGVAGQHDLTKILAKLWSEATAEDKKQYYQKYEEDKRRYDREMKAFLASEQQKAAAAAAAATPQDAPATV